MTVAKLQQRRDLLWEALTSGQRTITFEGRSVTYASVDELRAAILATDNEIARLSGTTKPACTNGVVVR